MILTGGKGSRLGQDKASATIAGVSLLDRVVTTIPTPVPIVAVGPQQESDRTGLQWTWEEPHGGGPVAGIMAGLAHITTPNCVILAVDMPLLDGIPELLATSLALDFSVDAVLAKDADDQPQPLCAAYRVAALKAAITHLGGGEHQSMRRLLSYLNFTYLQVPETMVARIVDIDTPADLHRIEQFLTHLQREDKRMLQEWTTSVAQVLGVDENIDIVAILDVTKDVAHNVQRPAAPITAYLMGVAVGQGMSVSEAAKKTSLLARNWPTDTESN